MARDRHKESATKRLEPTVASNDVYSSPPEWRCEIKGALRSDGPGRMGVEDLHFVSFLCDQVLAAGI